MSILTTVARQKIAEAEALGVENKTEVLTMLCQAIEDVEDYLTDRDNPNKYGPGSHIDSIKKKG